MDKQILVRAWIDDAGMVRSANKIEELSNTDFGLLILEIERSLNQFKNQYFSQGVATKRVG